MPIFDYLCNKCRNEFETLVMGGEKPQCPSCESFDLSKKISVFATHVKGGTPVKSAHSCSKCSSKHCGTCH